MLPRSLLLASASQPRPRGHAIRHRARYHDDKTMRRAPTRISRWLTPQFQRLFSRRLKCFTGAKCMQPRALFRRRMMGCENTDAFADYACRQRCSASYAGYYASAPIFTMRHYLHLRRMPIKLASTPFHLLTPLTPHEALFASGRDVAEIPWPPREMISAMALYSSRAIKAAFLAIKRLPPPRASRTSRQVIYITCIKAIYLFIVMIYWCRHVRRLRFPC